MTSLFKTPSQNEGNDVATSSKKEAATVFDNSQAPAELLPRVVRGCEYLKYLFPKKVREGVFLGLFRDMCIHNLKGRAELDGKWAERWMDFVLIVQALHIVVVSILSWISEFIMIFRRKE